ncbi:class I SAM-dependent methyltransferase [SAR202 cluster bacterium AD-804-J14_MRT_500m]|nr:class I SAM-dependent methyltransferase [SAR202 cluster bacterium AD-804-J14_MRT_500m]
MTAVDRWNYMVSEEHAQTERLRDPSPPTSDHWHGLADNFRMNPERIGDPVVDGLLARLQPNQVVIDVGAGAGRLTFPMAIQCSYVIAVEPSKSMSLALLDEANRYGIDNVELIQNSWESTKVGKADVVLCAHVLYTCGDIKSFVRKLNSHATSEVWVILFNAPPQRNSYPLWGPVHGEERLWLPALPQFEEILRELGIQYDVRVLESHQPGSFDNHADAWSQLRRRLFLSEGSEKDYKLGRVLADVLVEKSGQLHLLDAIPLKSVLVVWRPNRALI